MDPDSSPSPARTSRRPAGLTATAPSGLAAITIDEPSWRRFVPKAADIARRAAHAAGSSASFVLASDRTVRQLNSRDRDRNKPTNVLTYDPPGPGMAGEVILALGTIRREAAAAGRTPAHHLAHLVVHGALHLDGHDHILVGDARRMEMAEARILQRLRVPNPWKRS
jgi:probable rRNA maturation factor